MYLFFTLVFYFSLLIVLFIERQIEKLDAHVLKIL
jgi:hypothetical protein